MPRRTLDAVVKWKVTIPPDVAARVELRLSDDSTGRPIYGARSQLITELLTEWLEGAQNGNQDPLRRANQQAGQARS